MRKVASCHVRQHNPIVSSWKVHGYEREEQRHCASYTNVIVGACICVCVCVRAFYSPTAAVAGLDESVEPRIALVKTRKDFLCLPFSTISISLQRVSVHSCRQWRACAKSNFILCIWLLPRYVHFFLSPKNYQNSSFNHLLNNLSRRNEVECEEFSLNANKLLVCSVYGCFFFSFVVVSAVENHWIWYAKKIVSIPFYTEDHPSEFCVRVRECVSD